MFVYSSNQSEEEFKVIGTQGPGAFAIPPRTAARVASRAGDAGRLTRVAPSAVVNACRHGAGRVLPASRTAPGAIVARRAAERRLSRSSDFHFEDVARHELFPHVRSSQSRSGGGTRDGHVSQARGGDLPPPIRKGVACRNDAQKTRLCAAG